MKPRRCKKRKNGQIAPSVGDWGFRRLLEETDKVLADLEKRKTAMRYRSR